MDAAPRWLIARQIMRLRRRRPAAATRAAARRRIAELDLHGLVDGRLEPAERAEVERRLAADPQLAAEIAAWEAQAALIRELYDGVLREPLPERLLRPLAAPPPRSALRAAAMLLRALGGRWRGTREPEPQSTDSSSERSLG